MKRNIRKIPEHILAKLKTIESDDIVAGCTLKVKFADLSRGIFKHIGIFLTDDGLELPQSIIPSAKQGKYSDYNINGEVIVRRDLPKETDYNAIDSPNWGDWSNGSHTVYLPFERFPRQFRPARELEISMRCNDTRPNIPAYLISFRVEEVLSKTSKEFKKCLFENLNLLQENVGACDVQSANLSLAEYSKSLYVSWEILPPGTRDEAIARLFRERTPTSEETNIASERYDFFMTLKPKNLVYGSSGFRRYFGAQIDDNLVVFENIQYGNAIYVLFDNWEELSKRSRTELLSGKFGKNFIRVIHNKGWKKQVREIIVSNQIKKKKS